MTDAADENALLAEALAALHEVPERLAKAAHALGIGPDEGDAASDTGAPDSGPRVPRLFAAAREAVESFTSFVRGAAWPQDGAPKIVLRREPSGATVLVEYTLSGSEAREAVASFTAALRRSDERFLRLAELVGLIAGLCVEWASAGFAPPVVLASLHRHGARILSLGGGSGMLRAR